MPMYHQVKIPLGGSGITKLAALLRRLLSGDEGRCLVQIDHLYLVLPWNVTHRSLDTFSLGLVVAAQQVLDPRAAHSST